MNDLNVQVHPALELGGIVGDHMVAFHEPGFWEKRELRSMRGSEILATQTLLNRAEACVLTTKVAAEVKEVAIVNQTSAAARRKEAVAEIEGQLGEVIRHAREQNSTAVVASATRLARTNKDQVKSIREAGHDPETEAALLSLCAASRFSKT